MVYFGFKVDELNEADDIFRGLAIGLAASLHQRVIAQMQIKQEHDERRRAERNPMHNGTVTITPAPHIKTEGDLTVQICNE